MIRYRHHLFSQTALKWLGLVPLLLGYLCTSALVSALPMARDRRRRARVRNTTFFCRLALSLFNVRFRLHDRHRMSNEHRRGCLVIANHVSYVDVLALASVRPMVFITSVELKETRLLGVLARFAGSLFVERRKRSGLKQEISEIAGVLARGFSVVLFAEGTTSNGEHVHPFRRSLFDAAVIAKAEILPVCLRYTYINREPVTPANRDALFYYGGVSFGRHFPHFLSLRSVELEISSLKAIPVTAETTRRDLAASAHEAIQAAYQQGSTPGRRFS